MWFNWKHVTPMLFLSILRLVVVYTLYEDQIGVFDWHQQYIGNIKYSIIDPSIQSKAYYFGSSRNVIAAVNNRDGSIVWRNVLEEDGSLLDMKACNKFIASISQRRSLLSIRVWHSLKGYIIWEKSLSESGFRGSLACTSDYGVLFVAYGTNFAAFDINNGALILSKDEQTPNDVTDFTLIPLVKDVYNNVDDTAKVLLLSHKLIDSSISQLSTIAFSVSKRASNASESSSVKHYPELSLVNGLKSCLTLRLVSSDTNIPSTPVLTCLTATSMKNDVTDAYKLYTTSLLPSTSVDAGVRDWHQEGLDGKYFHLIKLDDTRFMALSSSDGSGSVYEIGSSGSPAFIYRIRNAMLACIGVLDGKQYLFAVDHEVSESFKNLAVAIYTLHNGKPVVELPARQWTIPIHHGRVDEISAVMFRDSSGQPSFRLLVYTEDGAVQLIRQNGRPQWVREEALADVVAVELVDLPVSESQARMEEEFGHANSNIFEMSAKRLRTQIAQLISWITKDLPNLFTTVLSSSSITSLFSGDRMQRNSARSQPPSDNSADAGSISTSVGGVSIPARLSLPSKWHHYGIGQNGSQNGVGTEALLPDEHSSFKLGKSSGRSTEATTTSLEDFLTRDVFNLHKMLVVATRAGKLYGLESERGRMVWEYLVRPAATVLADGKLTLFQQRNTAHFPLPPMMTLLLRSKLTGLPILHSFNPITGVPLRDTSSTEGKTFSLNSSDIMQAALYPGTVGESTKYLRPILMLDASSNVLVYPPEYSHVLFGAENPPVYIYTVEPELARLTGYRVEPRLSPDTPTDDSTPKATRVWRMRLQSVDNDGGESGRQVIVASAGRLASEHIYSVGRVLGNRSVLYKYLNPNLLALVTVVRGGGGSVDKNKSNALTIYLIDVVAGCIVYSATHQRCSEPVNLVHSENWIVYTYYNHKSLRQEATVLELFEPTTRSTEGNELCASYSAPGPWKLFLRCILPSWLLPNQISDHHVVHPEESSRKQNHWPGLGPIPLSRRSGSGSSFGSASIFSSLYRSTDADGLCTSTGSVSLVPHVLQQSYILSTPLRHGAAAVLLTERGITSKSIILGLDKGSLIELPKSFFDPRRTLDMTSELAEEGVQPYAPVLPLSDQSVISFNVTVAGIRAIRSGMTGLESTSLVFAYGLDMFFTRIAPSMTYDLLKEDFDYVAIAAVTIGMIIASIVTQRLAARRAIYRAWAESDRK